MKKPSYSRKQWHRQRARNQAKRTGQYFRGRRRRHFRKLVTRWDGERWETVISKHPPTPPPSQLCLIDNPDLTMGFFEEVRRGLLSRQHRRMRGITRRPRRIPRIQGYFDFTKISKISLASAVVLAAEYERRREITGNTPAVINLQDWDPEIIKTLFEIDFFSIVGISKDVFTDKIELTDDKMLVRIISGCEADVESGDKALSKLGDFLDPKNSLPEDIAISLNTALSEAMQNVLQHAYPLSHKFIYPHVNRWWMSGLADKTKKQLTVVIFDQGASIPHTYTKKPMPRAVLDWLHSNIIARSENPYANDPIYIKAAVEHGATQTGERNRGKGLSDMRNVISKIGQGKLRIWSRGGLVEFSGSSPGVTSSSERTIGGTLIEWIVEL